MMKLKTSSRGEVTHNFYILSNIDVPQEVVRYITSVFFDLPQEWIKFKNIYLNANKSALKVKQANV